jgi:glycosyltransferase involved in cell wall biosynthesis
MKQRLSICYAAPGHSLVPTSGTTRNILSLAEALSAWADVTVAFRDVPHPSVKPGPGLSLETIESDDRKPGPMVDDEATRGVNPLSHVAYMRKVSEFAKRTAGCFDLVLEKGWRLSGYLAYCVGAAGGAAAVVENDARCWTDSRTDPRTMLKWLLHCAAQQMAGHYSAKSLVVIAETEELRQQLHRVRHIPLEKIRVVPLGVNHNLFRPLDQQSARASVGIPLDKTILLYVGGMDKYHDLWPLLDALRGLTLPELELHIVGEGEYRGRYEAAAKRAKSRVVFHGRVSHERVPLYIAAGDLCLAPYCIEAFYDRTVSFSTLKIPEYMACARPVASIPSGEIKRLIQPGVSGFLFPNSTIGWRSFLYTCPDRDELGRMGEAARKAVENRSWEQTARGYMNVVADCGTPVLQRLSPAAEWGFRTAVKE